MTGMQKWIAVFVLAIGLVLMTYMITVESEPGLLPLVLVLVGSIWSVVAWRRARRSAAAD
jgi:hypothetical protein